MKAGNLILLLIVILIAFGFLLKDNLEFHKQQDLVQDQINYLNTQLNDAQKLLEAYQSQQAVDKQTIQDLQTKVESLEAEIWSLNIQAVTLTAENATCMSQDHLSDLLRSNPILLISVLLTQVAMIVVRYSKTLGIRLPDRTQSPHNEYMRLSQKEREWIISSRRQIKHRGR